MRSPRPFSPRDDRYNKKKAESDFTQILLLVGTDGETRTLTSLSPLDPKSSASTNSATSASK